MNKRLTKEKQLSRMNRFFKKAGIRYPFALTLNIILGCSILVKKSEETAPPENVSVFSSQTQSTLESINSENVTSFIKTFEEGENNPAKKDMPQTWWNNYTLGLYYVKMQQPTSACTVFKSFSSTTRFPLWHLANLRAIENCEELPAPKEGDLSTYPHWLQNEVKAVAYKKAKGDDRPQAIVSFAEIQKDSRDKLKLYDEAYSLLIGESQLKTHVRGKIVTLAPQRIVNPQPAEWLSVAHGFRRDRRFSEARSYYQKVIESRDFDSATILEAFRGLRQTYKLDKDNQKQNEKKYVETLERQARYAKSVFQKRKGQREAEVYYGILMTLARAHWTQHRVDKTQKILQNIVQMLSRQISMAEVYWMRGRISEEKGDFEDAVRWADFASRQTNNDPALKEKIQWQKAWNLAKTATNLTQAITAVQDLLSGSKNQFDKSKYLFWKSRWQKAVGLQAESKQGFEELILSDPLGFYGLVAHREIGKLFPSQAEIEKELKPLEDVKPPQDLDVLSKIDWLLSVDEGQLAQRLIDLSLKSKEIVGTPTYYKLLTKAEHYQLLISQLPQIDAEQRRQILAHNSELVFPRPHFGTVVDNAKKYDMSAEIIYSIIRQESGFNPNARSFADAFGLMQLLPETAQRVATHFNLDYKSSEDLLIPEKNIQLGTAYLKWLWQKFDGQFILMTASYNASEDAVRGWVKTRYRGDAIEFIEDIPYEETRGYVKLVMRNLIFYTRMFSKQPFPFPEWCLKGLQSFKD